MGIKNEAYMEEESVEELFQMWGIQSIASEDIDKVLKFYLYSKHKVSGFICVELQIDKNKKKLVMLCKSRDKHTTERFCDYIQGFMALNDFIE